MLDAASSVVEGYGLNFRIPAKEVATLLQGDWMRVSLTQVAAFDSGQRDQIVDDAQPKFLLDENFARQQQIKMFSHGTGERILDGNDGGGDRATLHAVKDLRRARTRDP